MELEFMNLSKFFLSCFIHFYQGGSEFIMVQNNTLQILGDNIGFSI